METLLSSARSDLAQIELKAPVILSLTNYVAMDLTANALLALGASPIMAHAEEELSELVDLASAVVINLGTLDSDWQRRMVKAVKLAGERGKPVILDPVGAGATTFRTSFARDLIGSGNISVVRGNASEIAALTSDRERTRGVDAVLSTDNALVFAKKAVTDTPLVIALSGETDYIVGKSRVASIRNGSWMMTRVTAMGCTATSVVAAFCAVNPSPYYAALNAMAVMALAGERASDLAAGAGSFRVHFLDQLGKMESVAPEALKVSHL